jgi:hypothetical protein
VATPASVEPWMSGLGGLAPAGTGELAVVRSVGGASTAAVVSKLMMETLEPVSFRAFRKAFAEFRTAFCSVPGSIEPEVSSTRVKSSPHPWARLGLSTAPAGPLKARMTVMTSPAPASGGARSSYGGTAGATRQSLQRCAIGQNAVARRGPEDGNSELGSRSGGARKGRGVQSLFKRDTTYSKVSPGGVFSNR